MTGPALLTPASVLTNYSNESLRELKRKADPQEQDELSNLLQVAAHEDEELRCEQRVASHTKGPLFWLRN